MQSVHIARVKMDRMPCFSHEVTELKGIIGHLWWSGHLASPLQAQDEAVEYETTVLEDEG